MNEHIPDSSAVSLELTKQELAKFISNPIPEVMSLRGHWGSGKTWTWVNVLEANKKNISLSKYSYVSLFGINDINELKETIFRSTINRSEIGGKPSLKTFSNNIKNILCPEVEYEEKGIVAWIAYQWKHRIKPLYPKVIKILHISKRIPYLDKYIEKFLTSNAMTSLSYLAVKDILICIDDMERIGEKLNLQDVFGLVTQLKEQRGCKIVLIFNDEKLNKNEEIFRTFREKVIDTDIKLLITPFECIKIVFGNCETIESKLVECCNHFSIDNIRVIQRIKKLYDLLKNQLKEFDYAVLEESIYALIPLVWAYYSQGKDVYEHVKNIQNKEINLSSAPAIGQDIKYLLNTYTYWRNHQLNSVLLFGVEHGFFIKDKLISAAKLVEERIIVDRKEKEFWEVWGPYHASFNDNEKEVVTSLHGYYIKHKTTLPLRYLDSILVCFREINQVQLTKELMDDFFETRNHDEILQEANNGFGNFGLTDEPLINKIKSLKFKNRNNKLSIGGILIRAIKENSYNNDDLNLLSEATDEDYYLFFKSINDADMRNKICREAAKFGHIRTDDERYKKVYSAVKEALSRIANESPLNKARVAVIDKNCL